MCGIWNKLSLAGVFLATSLAGALSRAETDYGRASAYPWSGYWWQHKSGGLTGPLKKYDRVASAAAATWEQENHVAGDVPKWFGHCHAWAASSVNEREPEKPRTVNGVTFKVGDRKGLLAACHAQDVANSYADRFGDGEGSEDRNDMAPDELWHLLQMYVKQKKIPLVLDLEAGEEVWNYPVYEYRVDYQPARADEYRGVLQLVAADNNVAADFVGTQPALHKYSFRFKLRDGAVVVGSAQWTGESAEDHPDFAWYPYVAVAENPDLDLEQVSQIVGFAVGGENTPPEDEPPPDGPPPDEPPPEEEEEDVPPAPPAPVQDTLSPDELLAVVLNKTSAFAFDLFVDKGDGGRYQAGEGIRISFRSGQEGYLYLFDVGPQADLRLVFPLDGQPNFIRKDVLYDYPAQDRKPTLAGGVAGQHDLKGIVTSRPIRITGFTSLPQEQRREIGQPATNKTAEEEATAAPAPPQNMLVCPTTSRRLRGHLFRIFRKGEEEAANTAPDKLGPFAQDMCSYFVLPDRETPPPSKTQP